MADGDRGLGRVGVWTDPDSLAIEELLAFAARVEQLGYGTLWIPDVVGREPFTLAGLLAGVTSSIGLGTSVVNIWGRDAQATKMAALHPPGGDRRPVHARARASRTTTWPRSCAATSTTGR